MNTLARRFLGFSTNPAAGAIPCYCNYCCFCSLGSTTGSARIRINRNRRGPPPALIQLRGLRRSAARPPPSTAEEEGDKKDETDDGSTKQKKGPFSSEEAAFEAMRMMKAQREFRKAYASFIHRVIAAQFGGGRKEKFDQQMKRFVDDFNKQATDCTVIPPKTDEFVRKARLLALLFVGNLFFMTWMTRRTNLRRGIASGEVSEKHDTLLRRPGISTGEFVQDYLSTGEVHAIYFYIGRDAIAQLQPDAIIKGQPFYEPGVHIELGDRLRRDPEAFKAWLEGEQHRIGITPRDYVPIAMQFPREYFYIATTIFSLLLGFAGYKLWMFGTRSFFTVVVRGGKKGSSKSSKSSP